MVKAINSAFVALAVAATLLHNVAALSSHQPHFDGLNHRDLAGHRHVLEKKHYQNLAVRQSISIPLPGDEDTNTTGPTGPTGPTGGGGGPTGGGSTTTPTTAPPTTNPPTTTEDTSTSNTSTTSTPSSSSSSTSTTASSTSSTSRTTAAQGTTVIRATNGASYTNTAALTSLRASTTSSTDGAASTGSDSTPFFKNKTAVAATATVVAIVGVGILIFVVIWLKKKQQRGKMLEEDMWDEAGMQEFSRTHTEIATPPPAVVAGGGLGRKNTVLPSQSAGAVRPTRSISPDPYGEEPDEILAVPPVVNYERPRDSAFDIVPAAPPPAAGQYGGSMQPPRRGDHTSFGSGLGVDPFAGTGFVDATRDSAMAGGGQAGRGAGYNMAPYDNQHPGAGGAVQMGNQWPQGYNPYTGYSQGGEEAYGNYNAYHNGHGYAH